MPYPTVPGRRMAWDADGTVALHSRTDLANALSEFGPTAKVELNDEDNTGAEIAGGSFGGPAYTAYWIFAELREIDGFYGSSNGMNSPLQSLYTSADTTHGADGTWTLADSDVGNTATVPSSYRTAITSLAIGNQRGVKLNLGAAGSGSNGLAAAHFYGEISAGETPDRLLFVDASTGLEFGLPIDYGDTPRGSEVDQTFKLKNNSATLTASAVQITGESLYLSSGAWYTFSEGGAFQSTLPLASSIGPGASSPTITVRRNIPDTETLGLHAGRIRVSPPTWT